MAPSSEWEKGKRKTKSKKKIKLFFPFILILTFNLKKNKKLNVISDKKPRRGSYWYKCLYIQYKCNLSGYEVSKIS